LIIYISGICGGYAVFIVPSGSFLQKISGDVTILCLYIPYLEK